MKANFAVTNIIISFSLLSLVACNIVKKEVHYIEKQSAPAELVESMKLNQSGKKLTLEKRSLEKWYLLMPQARMSGVAPQWQIFAAQIVYFKQSGKEVGLFQKNTLQAYQQISNDKLIQSFPVVDENAESVTVSWDQGLKALPLNSSFFKNINGISKHENIENSTDNAVEVISSFTHELKMKDNKLTVHQSVRYREIISTIQNPATKFESPKIVNNAVELTADLYLIFRPYKYNSNIEPKFSESKNGYGVFIQPFVEEGSSEIKEIVNQWDFSKDREPLIFAISSAFPAKYADVAEEAILYWNRVIGRNVIQVVKNVDPQSLPQERVVMVHWVDWNNTDMAYAGSNSDPLTGELLLGQIFFGSNWIESALFTSQTFDKKLTTTSMKIQFDGLQSIKNNCDYYKLNKTNSVILKNEQSVFGLIRFVITHEAGHIMGLTHNFAASFDAPMSTQQIIDAREKLISNSASDGAPVSSSTMDYPDTIDDLLIGIYIKNNILPYDKKVLDWLYNDKQIEEKLVYCSHDELTLANLSNKNIFGCGMFDSTPNPLLGDLHMDRLYAENSIQMLDQKITNAAFPAINVKRNLDIILNQINLKPILVKSDNLKSQLSTDFVLPDTIGIKSWRVDQLEENLSKEKTKSLYQGASGLGGMLLTLLPNFRGEYISGHSLDTKIAEYIENIPIAGKTYNGIDYRWTEAELADLKQFYKIKFKDYGQNYARSVLNFIIPDKDYKFNQKTQESTEIAYSYNRAESFTGAGDTHILHLVNQMLLTNNGSIVLQDGTILPQYKFRFNVGFEEGDVDPVILNLYQEERLISDDKLKVVVPNQFKSDLSLVIKSRSAAELMTKNSLQLKEIIHAEPNNTEWKAWALNLASQIQYFEHALR